MKPTTVRSRTAELIGGDGGGRGGGYGRHGTRNRKVAISTSPPCRAK